MTREGAEKVREAVKAIYEQCEATSSCGNCPFATARICPVMICLSVFLTIDFGRWSNECCYGN